MNIDVASGQPYYPGHDPEQDGCESSDHGNQREIGASRKQSDRPIKL
jgi:hypothetical protein